MSWILILEQLLNGLQFGLMLFLLAAGLTLVFGIMDMINLAHGSLYMVGAFLAAALVQATGSFALGVLLAVPATAAIGMLVRAGASNREMALAMGVDIRRLFTLLFGVGAGLCAVAGALLGPLLAVQVGMGENILILAFVVVVIGGIGSVRGALVGAVLVGLVDTIGRAFLPLLFGHFFQPRVASAAGPAIASVLAYLLMVAVLYFRPRGLFQPRA